MVERDQEVRGRMIELPGVQEPVDDDRRYLRRARATELDLSLNVAAEEDAGMRLSKDTGAVAASQP